MGDVDDEAEMCRINDGISDISQLGDLSGIKTLNLHCNQLKHLHGLPSIESLIELNLSSNAFTSVHLPELTHLPNLVRLDLSTNKLKHIKDMPHLQSLQELSLAYNDISSLDGLQQCPELVSIDVRGNRLQVPNDLHAVQLLSQLQHITLACSDGRHANPVCSSPHNILQIFDEYNYFGEVNGVTREQWAEKHIPTLTPKFDSIVRRYQERILSPSRSSTQDASSMAQIAGDIRKFAEIANTFLSTMHPAPSRPPPLIPHAFVDTATSPVRSYCESVSEDSLPPHEVVELFSPPYVPPMPLHINVEPSFVDVATSPMTPLSPPSRQDPPVDTTSSEAQTYPCLQLARILPSDFDSFLPGPQFSLRIAFLHWAGAARHAALTTSFVETSIVLSDKQRALDAVTQKNSELRETTASTNQKVITLQHEFELQQQRYTALEVKYRESLDEAGILRDKITTNASDYQKKICDLISSKDDLESVVDKLRHELELKSNKYETELAICDKEKHSVELAYQRSLERVQELEKNIVALREKEAGQEIVHSETKASLSDLRAAYEKLDRRFQKLFSSFDGLSKEYESQKIQLSEVQNENSRMKNEMVLRVQQHADDVKRIEEFTSVTIELKQLLEKATSRSSALEGKIKLQQSDIQQRRQKYKQEIARLVSKMQQLESETPSAVLLDKCQSLEHRVTEQDIMLKAKDKIIQDQLESIKQLKQRSQHDASEHNEVVSQLEADLEYLRGDMSELEMQLNSSRDTEKRLLAMLDDMQEENAAHTESLEKQLAHKEKALRLAQEKLDELAAAFGGIRTQDKHHAMRIQELQRQNDALSEAATMRDREHEAWKAQITACKQEIESHRKNADKRKAKLESTISSLRVELQQKTEELENATIKLQHMQKVFSAFQQLASSSEVQTS